LRFGLLLLFSLWTAVPQIALAQVQPLELPDGVEFIEWEQIIHRKLIPNDLASDPKVGSGTVQRYIGKLGGEPVHVKVVTEYLRPNKWLIQEIKTAKIFAAAGVRTPKYYGLTRLPDGNLGVVSEFIPGHHLSEWASFQALEEAGATFNENTVADIDAAYAGMENLRLYSADGPQFRIRQSDGHAFLIDLEIYERGSSPYLRPVKRKVEAWIASTACRDALTSGSSWRVGGKKSGKISRRARRF
jgi:hypothetical protein